MRTPQVGCDDLRAQAAFGLVLIDFGGAFLEGLLRDLGRRPMTCGLHPDMTACFQHYRQGQALVGIATLGTDARNELCPRALAR